MPFFGGPTKVDRSGTEAGEQVFSYGDSSIRGGAEPLSPKFGLSLGDTGGSWSHTVSTLTPGIPGDSGSGFLDDQGEAIGVLSTLNIAPTPASNGVGDLGRELDHAQAHSGLDRLRLVPGTREFSPLGHPGPPRAPRTDPLSALASTPRPTMSA